MKTIYVFRVKDDVNDDKRFGYWYICEHDRNIDIGGHSSLEKLAKAVKQRSNELRQSGINTGIRFKLKYNILNVKLYNPLYCSELIPEEQDKFQTIFDKN